MVRDRKSVEAGLIKKGFQLREGDHHFLIYWSITGKKSPVFTKTSHSHRDISDQLLGKMARQCRLPKGKFLDLIDCPLSRDEYEDLLFKAGVL
jgi:hypothetical protein